MHLFVVQFVLTDCGIVVNLAVVYSNLTPMPICALYLVASAWRACQLVICILYIVVVIAAFDGNKKLGLLLLLL